MSSSPYLLNEEQKIIRLLLGMREDCDFDIIPQEWKLVGGNQHFRRLMWQRNFPQRKLPDLVQVCYCGERTVENCYIQQPKHDKLLIICDTCLQRLIDEGQNTRCTICFQPHRNQIDTYCNDCRGGVLTAGRYKGKSFRWVYHRDRDYCKTIITQDKYQSTGNMRQFAHWVAARYQVFTMKRIYSQVTETDAKTDVKNNYQVDDNTEEVNSQDKGSIRPTTKPTVTYKLIRRSSAPPAMITLPDEEDDLEAGFDWNTIEDIDSFPEPSNSPPATEESGGRQKMGFGRHRSRTYAYVRQYHRSYCRWVLERPDPGPMMGAFQQWLLTQQQ